MPCRAVGKLPAAYPSSDSLSPRSPPRQSQKVDVIQQPETRMTRAEREREKKIRKSRMQQKNVGEKTTSSSLGIFFSRRRRPGKPLVLFVFPFAVQNWKHSLARQLHLESYFGHYMHTVHVALVDE